MTTAISITVEIILAIDRGFILFFILVKYRENSGENKELKKDAQILAAGNQIIVDLLRDILLRFIWEAIRFSMKSRIKSPIVEVE